MHVAYCGNFEPEHSTENEVRRALENNGHTVLTFQEGQEMSLVNLTMCLSHPTMFDDGNFDFVLWTRTGGLAARVPEGLYWKMLAVARFKGIPVVGYHLDRWWGLARQAEIEMDPFFRVDLLCTADGGHDERWERVGVNHAWFPPGISERHCHLGTPREEYTSDIAFVGSWQGGYHPEDVHRPALINWLKRNYDRRVKFWPEPGQHAIRGDDLTDLYASVKVVVGTSCLAPKVDGSPMTHYCSDRIPETMGRGGMLVHPSVEGIDALFEHRHQEYELGNFDQLHQQIDSLMAAFDKGWGRNDGRPTGYRQLSCDFIREHHTYEVRMLQLVDLLTERGMLR